MRIGTVGTNFVVDGFFDAVSKTDNAEVVVIYSRNEETAQAFAAKHNLTKWHTDREAFLNDPEVDVVYVASPNSLHYQWSLDALKAGKGVICEKPFVSTHAECEILRKFAQDNNLFLVEAVTVPHLPNFKLLPKHLDKIGPVRMAQLNFSQYSSKHKAYLEGKNPNVFNPAFAGGSLMDINYYNLRFILDLFGEPEDIRYFANLAENGIDTSGVLLMRYPGFVAEAVGAKDSRSENLVQIQGEKGYIKVPKESSRCLSVTVVSSQGEETFNEQPEENVLVYEMREFTEMFRNNYLAKRDEFLDMTCRAMKWLEKARKDGGVFFEGETRNVD
jgi:predicted dehydrogenase